MTSSARELWQGYEEDGEPILTAGVPITRAAKGALHGSAHMWLWREKNGKRQVLLQKRASASKTWPNHYDVSSAGHVNFEEAPLNAAVREAKEELGITIDPKDTHLLFLHRQELQFENITENEIQWVYGLDVTKTPEFQLDAKEVKSIIWVNLSNLPLLIEGKVKGKRIVPHGPVYFAELAREIRDYER